MADEDQDLDSLFEEEDDFWSGEDPSRTAFRRRRRGAGTGGAAGALILTPSILTGNDAMPPGTTIGTASVAGGFGTYTFSISDPSGRFTIDPTTGVISTLSPLSPAFYNITITADNGLGDHPSITTTIFVSHLTTYIPTYHIYGF